MTVDNKAVAPDDIQLSSVNFLMREATVLVY